MSFIHGLRGRLLLIAALAVSAIGVSTSPAMAIPAQTYVDTGWNSYDGGCQARTQVWYYTATNKIHMKTDVSDPYWFVACRVNAKPIFDTNFGPVTDTPTQYNYACAVFDPSCASTRYGSWELFDPASPTLSVLKSFGVDLGSAISAIRIEHTHASRPGASAASAKSRVAGAKRATKAQIEAKAKKFAARH
jgi:hypothetical protein